VSFAAVVSVIHCVLKFPLCTSQGVLRVLCVYITRHAQLLFANITWRAPSALCVHHTACSIALCEHHMACSECSFQLAMIGCVHLRPQVNLSLEALVAGHPAPLPGQPPASLQMFLELGRRGIPPAWKPAPVGGTTQEESVRRELTSRYVTPLTRRLAHTCVGCHAWPHVGVS